MGMVENRVRIIIEGDASLGVQSINQTNAALDTLSARGKQAGSTVGAALDDMAAKAAQGATSVGRVGGALSLLGRGGQSGGSSSATMPSVTSQTLEVGQQAQATVGQTSAALDKLTAQERQASEAMVSMTSKTAELGRQGQAAVGQVGVALDILVSKERQAGEATSSVTAKAVELGGQGRSAVASIEAAYARLGMRSSTSIRNEISQTIAAYRQLRSSGTQSAADIEAAYKAMQSRVVSLKQELSRSNFNGVKTDIESLSAATNTFSSSLMNVKSIAGTFGLGLGFRELYQHIKNAINIIDEYKRATIGIAATLTDTAQGTSEQLKYIYKDNLAYAEETYNKVQLAASKFFASGKEMTEAWQILTNKGLRLSSDEDINNLGIIVDKIKLMTQGQSSSLQIAQELRSVMTGQARAGDQLAMLIEDRIGPAWKQVLTDHIRSGDVLAFVASQVKGVGVATEDIQNTLTSGLSTQKTLVDQIVNAGLPNMYQDVVKFIQMANSFLENQKSIIAQTLSMAYQVLKAMAFTTPYARAVMSLGSAGQQQTGSNEIRQPVRNITIGGTLKYSDVVEQVKNALKREESFLKTPLTDQTKEITERYSKAFDTMRQSVSSGKLDQAGLASAGELWVKTLKSQQVELDAVNKKLNTHHKSATGAANAAARYGEQASGYLQQAKDQYDQLLAQWSGDTLGAKLAQIDKKYDQLTTTIRKGMIGAKGATTDAVKALEQLGANRALEKQLAQIEAWKKAMQEASSTTGRIGQLTGDPKAIYTSQMAQAQLWKAEQDRRLLSISDDTERAKQAAEVDKIYALEEVNARAQAYEGLKGVSDEYWTAERERVQNHLDAVRDSAQSELAYKMYEAQQWDEYNKKVLENQVDNAETYAEMIKAKWALAYGSYKSASGKARDSWARDADATISLTDSMASAIAGTFGDIVRAAQDGSLSVTTIWQNMLSRMADALAQWFTDEVKNWLKSLLSSFSGSMSGLVGSLFGSGTSALASSGSSVVSAMSSVGVSPWTLAGGFFAKGGAVVGSLPVNTILTSPTLFTLADSGFRPFATGGLGLAGEAGPEIIMPAVQMSDGHYGTRVKLDQGKSDSEAAQPVVNVPIKVVTIFDKAMVGDALREPGNVRIVVAEMEREGFRRQ